MNNKLTYPALIIFIALSLCLMIKDCFATQWAKVYGGGDMDIGRSIQQTADGGYIVTGNTDSYGAGGFLGDYWVVKLNSFGGISWQKTYGGTDWDVAYAIIETSDGGILVVGDTESGAISYKDWWILKLESDGDIEWQRGYSERNSDVPGSVQETFDGDGNSTGYIVAGSSCVWPDSEFWVVKINSTGFVQWTMTCGGAYNDLAYCIKQVFDGGGNPDGFIVVGTCQLNSVTDPCDAYVVRLNNSGGAVWMRRYGRPSFSDVANSVEVVSGEFLVGGYTSSYGAGGTDMWLFRLDGDGYIVWEKTYGGAGNDNASSISKVNDGNYIVAGTTSFGAGGFDIWLVKIDGDGDVLWEKAYGGAGNERVHPSQTVEQTTDGGYIVVAETLTWGRGAEGFLVIKTDENGNIPNCDIITETQATVGDTGMYDYSYGTAKTPTYDEYYTAKSPQDSWAPTDVVCEAPASIPTLSEWGLIIFMTLMIGIGVMVLRKRRMA